MKYRSLEILACPQCGSDLILKPQEIQQLPENESIGNRAPLCSVCAWADLDEQNRHECSKCLSHEVLSGTLECAQGHTYPIINGVPRLLPDATNKYNLENAGQNVEEKPKFEEDFLHTQASFSSEWQAVADGDSAWGKDIFYRKNLFLQGFDIQESQLDGKMIFDAGCGHGEVEMGIAESGAEIFAIDLSYAVDHLQERLHKLAPNGVMIHLFQANVYHPPFKPGAFDMIISDGVLHHTPNTFKGFKRVSRHLKPGGKCYILVYSNETKNLFEMLAYYGAEAIRVVTTRIPHSVLYGFCAFVSPFYWLYTNAFNLISGKQRYTRRTLRELKLSLFDGLSPKYDWHHRSSEVMGWYRSLGYDEIKKTVENQNGFGMVGVLKEAAPSTND